MEINVIPDKKMVEVWLSNAEKEDPAIQAKLKPLYAQYKQQKYLVAVYKSGRQDITQSVRDLLVYNKRKLAELEIQKEKKQRTATLER